MMGAFTLAKIERSDLDLKFRNFSWSVKGKVLDIVGTIVEGFLPNCQLGSLVEIGDSHNGLVGEVVGFKKDRVLILPYNSLAGVHPGCTLMPLTVLNKIPVGEHLLGGVYDAFLNPLSGDAPSHSDALKHVAIDQVSPNPMKRQRISEPISMGVRAIDGMLTFGKGQRVGVMAGSGVGKSVLMGMIAKNSSADINVIALIGERGREVREFIERDLGPDGLKKSVVVAVTGDQSPLTRIRGAKVATAISEYFSSRGNDVLLMLDSLTRVAMAQREIGNAIGEPPTTKGYTPSVFSLLPRLLERTGPQEKGKGSISGLYTVLVDGDDFNDPIADAARSILDGHINLSRKLASMGHYPAIEVSTSISRVMADIVSEDHFRMAQKLKSIMGIYQENIDLLQIGAYQRGSNPDIDEAIEVMPHINKFLQQTMGDHSDLNSALLQMKRILAKTLQN